MKSFTKHLAALFVLLSTLSSCDVETFIDDNFKEKSLVVLAPDFIKNRVTVILKDEETNEIIDEESKVSVYSNKKIIDLAGNYKNEFTVKRGVLQFALDPNEVVSDAAPWEFEVYSIDDTKKYSSTILGNKITSKGNETLTYYQKSRPNIEDLAEKVSNTNKDLVYGKDLYLTYNDMSWYQFRNPSNGYYFYDDVDDWYIDEGYLELEPWILNRGALEEELVIKIKFTNSVALNVFKLYYLSIKFNYLGSSRSYNVNSDGKYYIYNSWRLEDQGDFDFSKGFVIPKGAKLKDISLIGSLTNDYDLEDCTNGYNFKFSGVPEDTNLTFEYKTLRDGPGEGYISSVGYADLSSENTVVNTGDHFQSSNSNKVVFAENSQYLISPQEMDLGGDACGKTFDFKIFPKEGLEKYKLNLQFQCPGDDYSTAPSVSARFNKVGDSTPSEIVTLENGSTNLYLEENRFYKVSGSFNDSEFDFTFTNNQSEIQEAIRRTLAENKNLLNIYYFQREVKDEDGNFLYNLINAIVTFKEGGCPE